MPTEALIAIIFGAILSIFGLAALIYVTRDFVKNPVKDRMIGRDMAFYAGSIAALAIGLTLLMLALFLAHGEWRDYAVFIGGPYDGEPIDWGRDLAFALSGIFLFGLSGVTLWSAFAIHYGKRKLAEGQRETFSRLFFGSIPFFVLSFLLWMDGLAPYLSYPLINGFEFTANGFEWTTAFDMGSYNGLHIAFYGIIMIFGACVSYWVCDHEFYKEFHKHGILDSLLLVAFPAGVIGARIWYVVGNYEREFAGRPFWDVFKIWDGGITILGGAVAGIIAGYAFLRLRRKYVDPRWAVDVCVPSILLAQAIGRWGNFFNCEVYGGAVSLSAGWQWLPRWIALQMNCTSGGGYLGAGEIHVPLFLVEGILTFAGYFIIVYGLGKGLRKYLVKGDLMGFYFVWYGLVRVVMEPFRDPHFNMGADNAWSVLNALVYVVIGLAIILLLHLHDHYVAKKNPAPILSASLILLALALAFPALPSVTAAAGNPSSAAYATEDFAGFALIFSGKAPAQLAAYILLLIAFALLALSLALMKARKAKGARPLLYAAIAISLVGGLIFLIGKDWMSLDPVLDIGAVTYSLSYGFVLSGVFALWGALAAASLFLAEKDARKAEALAERENV